MNSNLPPRVNQSVPEEGFGFENEGDGEGDDTVAPTVNNRGQPQRRNNASRIGNFPGLSVPVAPTVTDNLTATKGLSNSNLHEKIHKIIVGMFQINSTLRLSHWTTKSGTNHKSLDKFLDKFMEYSDEFIEIWQGKYGRLNLKNNKKSVYVYTLSKDDISDYLDIVLRFLQGSSNKINSKYKISNNSVMNVLNRNKDTDLIRLKDKLIGEVNHLKYRLTLE
jgi:hypothetical protein